MATTEAPRQRAQEKEINRMSEHDILEVGEEQRFEEINHMHMQSFEWQCITASGWGARQKAKRPPIHLLEGRSYTWLCRHLARDTSAHHKEHLELGDSMCVRLHAKRSGH